MTLDFSEQPVINNPVSGPAIPGEVSTSTQQTPFNYNANIAQQESGNNPNIGYHNQAISSAFGPYGMTAGAYQDARKVNSSLPADITQANPQQLTQAQDAYTQQNAKYLQSYGIPVNDNTLSAAHFLGAKGLSDYQQTGYISPAAATANGGEDQVRQIVNARLGGQFAPASGGAQQTQPQPTAPISPEQSAQINATPAPAAQPFAGQGFQMPNGQTLGQLQQDQTHQTILNSDNHEDIAKLAFNPTIPKDVQNAAFDKLHNTMAVQQGMERAQTQINNLGQNPNPRELNRAMNNPETGNYFKVLMYQALGWTGKAKEELDKIDPPTEYTSTMVDGVPTQVKINKSNGQIMAGWQNGQSVNDKTLAAAREGYAGGKWQTSAEFFEDKAGNIYQSQHNDKGSTRLVDVQTNKPYTGGERLNRLRDTAKLNQMATAQGYRRENFDNSVVAALQKKRGTDVLGALNDFESQSTTPLSDSDRMAFIQQYGGYKVPTQGAPAMAPGAPAAAGVTPITGGAPAAAGVTPITGGAPAMAPSAPPMAGNVPTTTSNVDATGRPLRLPTEGAKSFASRMKDYEENQGVLRKEQEAFVKPKGDISANSRVGQETANITRTQINDLLNTPEMMGYLTAGPGTTQGQTGKFIREVITGAYDADASGKTLSDKMRELSIPIALQSRIQAYQQQNVRINALTLKQNEGAGSISNFENKQNQAANMSNIGDLTPYSALTGLGKRQFVGDMTMAKQQFLNSHPEFRTETAFENAWGKEQDKITKGYQGIYQARLDTIKPYYDQAMKNPNDERAQQAYRDAAIGTFKTYPTPDYNPQTGKWEYKTKQAKLAAMNAIVGGQ
jgi:hypothetical protein